MSGQSHSPALGKYQVRGVIGKGAMGTVYDGWDPLISRRVAIKSIPLPDSGDPDAIEGFARFRQEAQAGGRLNHPNIVGVYDYGETAELAYIVMEFIEGRSLKDILANREPMSPANAVRLMEDILSGLAYSHDRGVVHRDIKPANIMITDDGRTKIADFGIARIESNNLTQAGTLLGTPAYMSPEQFMGQAVDRRTDIYSCGVLLYHLLTGERPFEGGMTAIMHKALTTVPPRPSELSVTAPASLDGVVARAMARRPDDRFATAADFARALRAPPDAPPPPLAIDETMVLAPITRAPEAVVSAAAPPRPARRLPLMIGGGAALLAAALAVWQLAPTRSSAPAAVAPLQQAMVPEKPPPAAPVAPPVATAPTPPPAVTAPVVPPASATSAAPPVMKPLRDAAAIRTALAATLPNLTCTLVQATTQADGAVAVSGVAGSAAAAAALHSAIDQTDPLWVDWQVRTIDSRYCAAIDTLRPIAAGMPDLALQGDPASLADGEVIPLRVTFPGFSGYLHVAYLGNDASVTGLVPGAGYPSRLYQAGEKIAFGEPRKDFAGWIVGPPPGTDMIVAIASSAPLFAAGVPDKLDSYVAGLQAALADLRRRGETVAAAVLPLVTAPPR
jgi:serine/threonine-protein kinase